MMNKKVIAVALALALAGGSYAQDDTAKKKVKAYMVSDAHLDTQWNWDIQTTINEYVWNTISQNLFLLKKYPEYIFNFEGGVKYAWMKEYYPELPVYLNNDAKAAAIGEMIYGGAQGMKNFIMVTLGTGLGSGFVVNGELVYGHDGFAGELGHTIVSPNGRQCGCGRSGCLETYVSATGVKRTAYKMMAKYNYPSELRSIPFNEMNAKIVSEAAQKGDMIAINTFKYTGKMLGEALANAVAITSPEAIFLMGGLAKAGDLLFEPVKDHMEMNLLKIYSNKVKILPSKLTKNVAIYGAAALVWKELEK